MTAGGVQGLRFSHFCKGVCGLAGRGGLAGGGVAARTACWPNTLGACTASLVRAPVEEPNLKMLNFLVFFIMETNIVNSRVFAPLNSILLHFYCTVESGKWSLTPTMPSGV
jgi:hypothetical protein